MYTGLEFFKMASALAEHTSQRQQAVARNIANADTPGYHAADLAPFSESYRSGAAGDALRSSRSGHIADPLGGGGFQAHMVAANGDLSPNGNDVSLETEMMKASEIRQNHSLALTVYRSGLDLLRTGLGR